ncbi:MAG: KilA-N domain-containing protein [Saprospiraceae bacterium]|nr:KilA-N domain-containing protein [Saprospiraceae bacterium]
MKRWVETTSAIGIKRKRTERVPALFAHKDIALGFCYWLSPPFQLYVLNEFQKLKIEELQAREKALN